jgi:transposase-like protein
MPHRLSGLRLRPPAPARDWDGVRSQFPSEQAALKVLYLAVRNLDEFRSPSVGTRSSSWKKALQAFTIYFDGRIPTP